jgi:hypothetical protein
MVCNIARPTERSHVKSEHLTSAEKRTQKYFEYGSHVLKFNGSGTLH